MDNEKKEVEKGAVVPYVEGKGLVPNDFDGMWRLAHVMAASRIMPTGMEKTEVVFVALQYGFELGFTPMQSVQSIAVINGRPIIWGDAPLALVRKSGMMKSFEERQEGEGEAFKATAIAYRVGEEKPIARSFGMKQAATAKLLSKDNWKNYPERMCQMRARSWCLRDGFGDVLKGLRTDADIDDIEEVQTKPNDVVDGEIVPEPTKEKPPVNKEEMYGGKSKTAGGSRPHPDYCEHCGHKHDECICESPAKPITGRVIDDGTEKPPYKKGQKVKGPDGKIYIATGINNDTEKQLILESDMTKQEKKDFKVDSETLGPEKKESFLPDDEYPDQAGDVQKQAPGKPEGQDEEIVKSESLTIGRPEWELASYKSARTGTFHKDTPFEKWTGFAKYVFENRKTWQNASIVQRQSAEKKWGALYGDTPFLLNKFGAVIPDFDPDYKIEAAEKDDSDNQVDDSDHRQEPGSEEPPDDAELVRLDLIGKVAKAKYVHKAAYVVACDSLFENGLISTEKVSDMTAQEAEILMRAINARVDRENKS